MKLRTTLLRLFSSVLLATLFIYTPANAQDAKLRLNTLDRFASVAGESVSININESLLQKAANLLSKTDAEQVQVKELIQGLKGIYVRSFEFEEDKVYTEKDIEAVRTQLRAPGWTQIVDVRSKREGGSVEVYILDGVAGIGGLAIIGFAPRELTVVNIVGPVDLERLSRLEGNFGIPALEIERTDDKRKK